MAVKIIIYRRVPSQKQAEIIPLLKELRAQALKQPGYISGETLHGIDDPNEYLVISTWEKLVDWQTWASNPIRVDIQNKIDKILGEKTIAKAYYYG